MKRVGYRSTDSLPGTTTYVDESSSKGIGPRDTKYHPTQQDGGAQDPAGTRRRERALPAPDGADNEVRRPSQPVYNAPGPSGTSPDGKSIHKDKVRTKGVPGERYNPEPIDQSKGQFRRRTMDREGEVDDVESAQKKPMPSAGERQKAQKGKLKKYMQIWHRKNKGRRNPKARLRMRLTRKKGYKKREEKYRNKKKNDKRFKRKPGGGYGSAAQRTKDWRNKKTRTKLKVRRKTKNRGKNRSRNVSDSKRMTRLAALLSLPPIEVWIDDLGMLLTLQEYCESAQEISLLCENGEQVWMDLEDFVEDVVLFTQEDADDLEDLIAELVERMDFQWSASQYFADGTEGSDMNEPSPERVAEFYRKQEWNPQRSDDSRQETSTPGADQVTKNDYEGLPTWLGPIKEERENKTPAQGNPVQRDRPGAPGSAKVIPRGQGFAGRTAAKGPSEAQVNFAKALFDKMLKKKWMDAKDVLSEDEIRKLDARGIGELITELKKIRDEKQVWKALPYLRAGVPPRWKKKGSRVLVAAKMAEILGGTASGVHERSKTLSVKMSKVIPKSAMWLFDVSGGEKTHRVRLQAIRKGNNKTLAKADVRISCDCNFWRWQGPEHWAKAGGYLYGRAVGTASQPVIRDPNGQHKACKHVVAVLQQAADYRFRSRQEVERSISRMKELDAQRKQRRTASMDSLVDLLFPSAGRVAQRYLMGGS